MKKSARLVIGSLICFFAVAFSVVHLILAIVCKWNYGAPEIAIACFHRLAFWQGGLNGFSDFAYVIPMYASGGMIVFAFLGYIIGKLRSANVSFFELSLSLAPHVLFAAQGFMMERLFSSNNLSSQIYFYLSFGLWCAGIAGSLLHSVALACASKTE